MAVVVTVAAMGVFAPSGPPGAAELSSLPSISQLTESQRSLVATTASLRRELDDEHVEVCEDSQALAVAGDLLEPWGIATPNVRIEPAPHDGPAGHYVWGSAEVGLVSCERAYVLAHELGHYVFDQAAKDMRLQYRPLAARLFGSGDWINGYLPDPGLEYAAHCIANVLYGQAPGTRCPDPVLRERAVQLLLVAGSDYTSPSTTAHQVGREVVSPNRPPQLSP